MADKPATRLFTRNSELVRYDFQVNEKHLGPDQLTHIQGLPRLSPTYSQFIANAFNRFAGCGIVAVFNQPNRAKEIRHETRNLQGDDSGGPAGHPRNYTLRAANRLPL